MLSLNIVLLYYVYFSLGFEMKEDLDLLGITFTTCANDIVTSSNGIPMFLSNVQQKLQVFYQRPIPDLQLGFTSNPVCQDVSTAVLTMEENTDGHVALVSFTTPNPSSGFFSQTRFYICTKTGAGDWKLQDENYFGFFIYEPFFTPLTSIIVILLTYAMSSLMAGLNIGLLALDPDELALLKNAGSAKERKHARKILPVRRCGNFLLCSILITATLCNAISTVVVDDLLSAHQGWVTVLVTTVAIVLFCEILPQAICTTYPLFIGANTIYVTIVIMLLTAPISYPLGKILDWLFGKESLIVAYDKERLRELLELTQLASHEAKIIAGTLNLSRKTVEEIMTVSNDIFKLPITTVLDFETISQILASGYSRIPIYVNNPSDIHHVLFTKDLALLDPADKVPVKVLVKNSNFKFHYIPRGTTVDKLLEIFKDSRYHMIFIEEDRSSYRPTNLQDKNVIGLVTFEDVIEEILQMEINDETDKFTDNRSRRILESQNDILSILSKPSLAAKPSENLKSAMFSFLSGLDLFSATSISPKVLRALLNLNIYYLAKGERLPQDTLYVQGVPADYFVMILEGEMELKIGLEGLTFTAGAFRYFGTEALKNTSSFVPDYMLQATKKSTYIKIDKALYDAAVLATQYERLKKIPNIDDNSDLYMYYKQLVDSL